MIYPSFIWCENYSKIHTQQPEKLKNKNPIPIIQICICYFFLFLDGSTKFLVIPSNFVFTFSWWTNDALYCYLKILLLTHKQLFSRILVELSINIKVNICVILLGKKRQGMWNNFNTLLQWLLFGTESGITYKFCMGTNKP